ncbi:redox-sensitive transcriptional activator SoxR [Parahaliea maris]|uniref:Redox-sensitive transcriptional activator SoxR n=1 Tax=Parahaliea maris TaxID=2716870 RepID=A0A5C8ZPU7_9GAMM|nr:redox-sensitive transcriptional activator SoxR [Parahaliea maris]TXS89537.1 redox-sensitive transcriptional activator SoxR [Parahaliea maris]
MVESEGLSVGKVAERAGVSVATLHFYENRGLISSWRNNGNQRRYRQGVLRRIAVIKTAQRLGLSLAEIAAAMETLPADRTPTKADWKRLSSRWRGQLQARIDQLEKLRDQLDGCIGCGCLSLQQCRLRNPDDIAAEEGDGAIYLER